MTQYNDHMRVAEAMLHGHLYVDAPGYIEQVWRGGHSYTLHPPLPAFICLPFAALGLHDQQLVSIILGTLSVLLAWYSTRSLWLAAFFAIGTTFAYESALGASWDFCLVASTVFTFAALISTSPRRTGLFACLAALCRYDLVLAFPVYLHARKSRQILWGLLLWAGIYCWWSYTRMHTVPDPSLHIWYNQDPYRFQVGDHGPFSFHYLPMSLYVLLFAAPSFSSSFPWFRPTLLGQALFSLSPAFLTADFTPWILAAGLCSIPALTVWASGFAQLGCRYYVQVFPFLLASMRETPTTKRLIVLSIISSTYFSSVAWIWGLTP